MARKGKLRKKGSRIKRWPAKGTGHWQDKYRAYDARFRESGWYNLIDLHEKLGGDEIISRTTINGWLLKKWIVGVRWHERWFISFDSAVRFIRAEGYQLDFEPHEGPVASVQEFRQILEQADAEIMAEKVARHGEQETALVEAMRGGPVVQSGTRQGTRLKGEKEAKNFRLRVATSARIERLAQEAGWTQGTVVDLAVMMLDGLFYVGAIPEMVASLQAEISDNGDNEDNGQDGGETPPKGDLH